MACKASTPVSFSGLLGSSIRNINVDPSLVPTASRRRESLCANAVTVSRPGIVPTSFAVAAEVSRRRTSASLAENAPWKLARVPTASS